MRKEGTPPVEVTGYQTQSVLCQSKEESSICCPVAVTKTVDEGFPPGSSKKWGKGGGDRRVRNTQLLGKRPEWKKNGDRKREKRGLGLAIWTWLFATLTVTTGGKEGSKNSGGGS